MWGLQKEINYSFFLQEVHGLLGGAGEGKQSSNNRLSVLTKGTKDRGMQLSLQGEGGGRLPEDGDASAEGWARRQGGREGCTRQRNNMQKHASGKEHSTFWSKLFLLWRRNLKPRKGKETVSRSLS